jgi:two-component system response regulator EvgA
VAPPEWISVLARSLAAGGGGTIHRVGPTALIVDDHPGFRTVARRMLEGAGFGLVMDAPDGATAIETVRRTGPDLVLLDIGLPGMDGIEVAELIAREPDAPTVVLTSGRDPADYGDRIAASRAAGFVPKGELTGVRVRAFLAESRT